jgi:organic hydroperoxide reductase OsmC/OhrA
MLWFLSLARERRLRVVSYEDHATGTLDHGTFSFTGVVLRPAVEFRDEVAAEVVDELHEGAHRRCYVANSVSCPVTVEATIAEDGEATG